MANRNPDLVHVAFTFTTINCHDVPISAQTHNHNHRDNHRGRHNVEGAVLCMSRTSSFDDLLVQVTKQLGW
jgi:hypothetical protein